GSGCNTSTVHQAPDTLWFNTTVINSGTGTDVVNVRRTTGALTVNGQDGTDTVTIGSTDLGIQPIHGNVFVSNSFFRTTLNVTDAPGTTAHNVVLDHSGGFNGIGTISGLAPSALIQYRSEDVLSVNLTGSTKGDSF